MDTLILALIFIYFVGYFACLFSWFFSQESREYIRNGDISMLGILVTSFNWVTILYTSIKQTFK